MVQYSFNHEEAFMRVIGHLWKQERIRNHAFVIEYELLKVWYTNGPNETVPACRATVSSCTIIYS